MSASVRKSSLSMISKIDMNDPRTIAKLNGALGEKNTSSSEHLPSAASLPKKSLLSGKRSTTFASRPTTGPVT